jgi:hypothetical protein
VSSRAIPGNLQAAMAGGPAATLERKRSGERDKETQRRRPLAAAKRSPVQDAATGTVYQIGGSREPNDGQLFRRLLDNWGPDAALLRASQHHPAHSRAKTDACEPGAHGSA